jgi:hypothetical protein
LQFLKSLFCLQGFDNRTRFFAISSATYVIFIMLSSAFIDSFFISLILLIILSLILGLTSLRRLHDAKLNKKWLLAPSLTFSLVALIIILSKQNSSYYLLIVPSLCSAILLTYPKHTKRRYILGYYGPVDMKEYQQEKHTSKQAQFRIEPTLINSSEDSYKPQSRLDENTQQHYKTNETDQNNYSQHITSTSKKNDIGELIRLKLLSNRTAQLTIAAVIGLVLIGVTTSWVINYFNDQDNDDTLNKIDENTIPMSVTPSITRNYPLTMPDNYTLYLSDHRGISINWQADEVDETVLWTQLTAQGDESCKEISFNKGEPIRTLSVQVEKSNGSNVNYFANFSPLDSKTLIQALAFRGNFTLCGYNFSLKGSQAALAGNKQYAQWVDY